MPKGCIIYCIEGGILEKHTLLSIASIKEFGGFLNDYDIFCVQPRKEFPISKSARTQLEAFKVSFIDQPLNIWHRYYAILNKPLAINYIMEHHDYNQYIFLDSDSIIVNEPRSFLKASSEICLSPVYTKGIGIHELQDKNATYWSRLFELANANTSNLERTKTRIEGDDIIGYWNAGIMVINGNSTLIDEWKNLTIQMLEERIYPESGIFFLEQSALAATIHAKTIVPADLELSHNFPLIREIFQSRDYFGLKVICIIHHLNKLELLDDIPSKLLPQNKRDWIRDKIKSYKIPQKGIFTNISRSMKDIEKKLRERFYFFIYKFTHHKKDN